MTSDDSISSAADSPETIAPAQNSPAQNSPAQESAEQVLVAQSSAAIPPAQPVVARYGQYYRNTRYIMATLTVVMGFWFGYDGFVRWPAENNKISDLEQQIQTLAKRGDLDTAARLRTELKSHTFHSKTDVQFQKVLAFALPPLGLALLFWALYNSRGEYRLAETTLYVPGHPPIPLTTIQSLDEHSWERKGIAVIRYELTSGEKGVVKLDDFVYDRPPTDAIYDRIKAHLQPAAAEAVVLAESEAAPASHEASDTSSQS